MHRIRIFCPKCKIEVEAERYDAGKSVRCPGCSKIILIPEPDIEPGTQIAAYTVLRYIGSGGMGDVWLARHNTMDRKAAIKVLSSKFSGDSHFIERFLNEVRTLAKLQHPNIVSAYDAGSYRGIYYLVMNYVDGVELDKVIRERGHLRESESLLIASAVASALSHAWNEFKIVHRDIKPGNIIIDSNGKPYLMDLGISKSLDGTEKEITIAGAELFGTPDFMSPEQAKGEKQVDFRSDIYSLGANLYQMLTGRLPYEAETPITIAAKHITDPIPSPRQVNSLVSKECDALIRKMMSKLPDERQPSWEAVIKDIQKVISGQMPSECSPYFENNLSSTNMSIKDFQKPKILFDKYSTQEPTEAYTQKPVRLLTKDVFAKKQKTTKNKNRKTDNRKNLSKAPYLALTGISLFIILCAIATYWIVEFGEPTPKKESEEHRIENISEDKQNEQINDNFAPIVTQAPKTAEDEISHDETSKILNDKTSDDDTLRQIALKHEIPYPPPPPLKDIETIEKERIKMAPTRSEGRHPAWVQSKFDSHKAKLIEQEKTIWKVIAIYLLMDEEGAAKNYVQRETSGFFINSLHVRNEFKAYFDSPKTLQRALREIRNNMASLRIDKAKNSAIGLGGKLSEALLVILENYEKNIMPTAKARPSSISSSIWRCNEYAINFLFCSTFLLGEYDLEFYDYEIVPTKVLIRGNLFEKAQFILTLNPSSGNKQVIEAEVYPKFYSIAHRIPPQQIISKLPQIQLQYESKYHIHPFFGLDRWEWADLNATCLFCSRVSRSSPEHEPFTWKGSLFENQINLVNKNHGWFGGQYLAYGIKCAVTFRPYAVDILMENAKTVALNDFGVTELYSSYVSNNELIKSVWIQFFFQGGNRRYANPWAWTFTKPGYRIFLNNPSLPATSFYADDARMTPLDIYTDQEALLREYVEQNEKIINNFQVKRKTRKERFRARMNFDGWNVTLKLSSAEQDESLEFNVLGQISQPRLDLDFGLPTVNFRLARPRVNTLSSSSLLADLLKQFSEHSGSPWDRQGLHIYISDINMIERGTITLKIGNSEAKLLKKESR